MDEVKILDQTRWRRQILKWYKSSGRHDLPWQQPRTPYRVWISEIMLQQTQVVTVIPYFEKFMNSFPTIEDLATASLDEVLLHWAGLGYYARARHLHAAAQKVVNEYQGIIPDNFDDLIILPGIGRSTAGAILSLGYAKPAAILDGNVKRILARTHGISFLNTESLKKLWGLAEHFVPKNQAPAYTQALMDLGSLICKRTSPFCQNCPLKNDCYAFQHNQIHLYSKTLPRVKKPVRNSQFLLLHNRKREVFLYQRPLTGIWGGLWSLIEQDSFQNNLATNHIFAQGRHTFTHFHLDYGVSLVKFSRGNLPNGKWFNEENYKELGLPALMKKILQKFYDISV